jgi:hypothetical protein
MLISVLIFVSEVLAPNLRHVTIVLVLSLARILSFRTFCFLQVLGRCIMLENLVGVASKP